MRAFARAVPMWAWLAAIVAVSAAIRFVLARGMVAPWIMVDELVYSELAKSFAASGHFEIRGVAAGGSYGFVYPLLISPAYRLFDSVPDAYAAAKAINSVVMSLAAVPAYFLARRVLNRPFALAAAALVGCDPVAALHGDADDRERVLSVFLCVALVLVRMLERPTAANQLGAARALRARVRDAAAGARAVRGGADGAAAARAATGSDALSHALRRRRARSWSLALVVEAARGVSPLVAARRLRDAGRHGYSVGAVAKWLLWHVAELDLYLGVVPVAAFVVLAFAWRSLDAPQRAFMAGAAALTGWLLARGRRVRDASRRRAGRGAQHVLRRAALPRSRCCCGCSSARRGRAPSRRPSAVAAALLVATLPFPRLIGPEITSDTLALRAVVEG